MKIYLFLAHILTLLHSTSYAETEITLKNTKTINSGTEILIDSTSLGEERSILISLPKEYEKSTRKYPVLVTLDGDFFFKLTSSITEHLAYSHQMDDSIVVAIPQKKRHYELKGTGANDFIKFLDNEVLPLIKNNYRTNEHNTIIGHSLGGSLVINLMINNTELFDAYIAISPVIGTDETTSLDDIESFLKTQKNKSLFFYLSKGNESGHYKNTIPLIGNKIEKKSNLNHRYFYKHYESENHGSVPLPSMIESLNLLYDGWIMPEMSELSSFNSTDDIEKLGGYKQVEKYYSKYAKKLGVDFFVPYIVYSRFAWTFYKENQHEKLKTLVKDKGKDSNSERVNYYLSQAYISSEKYKHAIDIIQLDLKHHPSHVLGWSSLGQAYEGRKEFESAKEAYQKALALLKGSTNVNLIQEISEKIKNIDSLPT